MRQVAARISIVIPVFNEEENIEILYGEIRKAMDPLGDPYEVIFVDDGSTDQSAQVVDKIIQHEAEEHSPTVKTRLVQFRRNFGQTAAMQAGFDYAQGEILVSLDGDLQNDPADIPRLLRKLDEGYDMVCGWRKSRQDKAFTRILPSRVANWLIRRVTGAPVHDNGCSLRAYTSEAKKSLNLYSEMHRFIAPIALGAGVRVTEIVVNHRPRRWGKTKYGLSRIWSVFLDLITVKLVVHFHEKPIVWFAGMGLVSLLLGIGLLVMSCIQFFIGEYSMVFVTGGVLFCFLFGSLLFWGLLGEYFASIERTVVAEREKLSNE